MAGSKREISKYMRLYVLVLIIGFVMFKGNVVKAANDSFTNAKGISVNKAVTDRMVSSSDYKYYKFTLASDGYVRMSFSHKEQELTGRAWEITLYDIERNGIKTIESKQSEANVTSNNIGLPKGTYYILVTNARAWLSTSTIDYQLTINYTATTNWETENNDGFLKADNMVMNQPIYGSMLDSSDYDYYKIMVPKAGWIQVTFSHVKLESESRCWEITLYDMNRNKVYDTYELHGNYESETNYYNLAAGDYYVLVTNARAWLSTSTIDYSLIFSYLPKKVAKPKKAQINKIGSNKKASLYIKWSKLNDATGYQIMTATNKKFTKNKNIITIAQGNTTKKTIKKLKRRKTYYVKVRGYKIVDGETYYGSYSKVKKVKVR